MRFLRIRPLRLDLGDVLVQIVAVFLGVVCAFAVNAWQAQNAEQTLFHATLRGIVVEAESNQSSLRTVQGQHAETAAALKRLIVVSRKDRFISSNDLLKTIQNHPSFGTNEPLDIAWQLAQDDQGLSLLSYDDRYALAQLYQVQSAFYLSEKRFGDSLLSLPQSPTDNYFIETLDLADQAAVVDLAGAQLDRLYSEALPKIRVGE
jgi:hypothetical protein